MFENLCFCIQKWYRSIIIYEGFIAHLGIGHICDAPWHFVPKCGKTWRRENALRKWRNLRNCTLLRNLYVAKRHLLTSFKAQEAQNYFTISSQRNFYYGLEELYMRLLTNYLPSSELEELVDFKKKQKKRLSDTFCVGRSAFYSFSIGHIKDQKNKRVWFGNTKIAHCRRGPGPIL